MVEGSKREEPRAGSTSGVGWASRLWMRIAGAKGIKKALGPIWPTARGSSRWRSCRLGLARDGRKSPVIAGRSRRDEKSEVEVHLHSEVSSS